MVKRNTVPPPGLGSTDDLAAMAFDDGTRDRQTDSHAVAFGRDERLKQLVGDFRRNARPGIGDKDFHQFAVRPARNQQFPARGLLHGLDRIADQVQQYLLDLDLVDQDEVVHRIDLKPYSHAVLLRAHKRERAGFFDQAS